MIAVGHRVQIHRPHTTLHHRTGEVVRVQVIEPRPTIMGASTGMTSRLVTVRLDDGTLVEPPLLLSDLQVISPGEPA